MLRAFLLVLVFSSVLPGVALAEGEVRGLWVTRWNYKNAPDVKAIFSRAQQAGFTDIFFQVRGRGDAFYRSELVPWASELTGTLGQDPGWDPLGTALAEGAARGLRVHAWLNTFPAWSGDTAPVETTPRHVLLAHPDWISVDEAGRRQTLGDTGYLCLSPGNPGVRDHVVAVVDELLRRYRVDGVHLDYIRYCGQGFSHDAASEADYQAALKATPGLSREDWQRGAITELVRRVRARVDAGPGALLSAAVWHNANLEVAGTSGYRDYYQDAHRWSAEGLVDALVPMNYLRRDSDPSFDVLADDHLAHRGRAKIWMGVHVLGRNSEPDETGAKMLENIAYARSHGADGVVLFALTYLDEHSLWEALSAGPFSAEPPAGDGPESGPSGPESGPGVE